MDRSFAALGDPVRRAILRLLAEGEQPVGAVVEALAAVRAWLDALTEPVATFAQPLDALATEIARGRRARRHSFAESGVEPGRELA